MKVLTSLITSRFKILSMLMTSMSCLMVWLSAALPAKKYILNVKYVHKGNKKGLKTPETRTTWITCPSGVFFVTLKHILHLFLTFLLLTLNMYLFAGNWFEQENVCYSYFQYSTKASAIISFAKILEIAVASFLKKKKKKKIELLF